MLNRALKVAALSIFLIASILHAEEEENGKILNDYKQKGPSKFELCKSLPLHSSKVKEIRNSELNETYLVTVDSEPTLAGGDTRSPLIEWRGDMNGDGLTDLFVNRWGCGSDHACVYDLMIHCGEGKYVSLIQDRFGGGVKSRGDYLHDPNVTKETKTFKGTKWRRIKASDDSYYDFDGKTYN